MTLAFHQRVWFDELSDVAVMLEDCPRSVFHLAISNMAQRHVAFYERHVAL